MVVKQRSQIAKGIVCFGDDVWAAVSELASKVMVAQ